MCDACEKEWGRGGGEEDNIGCIGVGQTQRGRREVERDTDREPSTTRYI
jgi:hypothetical protein